MFNPVTSRTQPCCLVLATVLFAAGARAEDAFERAPILYSKTRATDAVARLDEAIRAGKCRIDTGLPEREFVAELLREFRIPVSSQVLVFSKTSLQNSHIHPRQPRALYFNDDIYLGWSHGSNKFELIAGDPRLGAVFYLLERDPVAKDLAVSRQSSDCFSCHASGRTGGRPGMVVRSVFADREGQPIFSAGSFTVGHDTPFENRWGGWYVTGQHGKGRHLGNLYSEEAADGRAIFDREQGANLDSLDRFFDPGGYLEPTSDIVALMVMEHQVGMHNQLIEGNYTVRSAIYRSRQLNRELGMENPGELSDSSKRVIDHQAGKILKHMMFADEAPLPEGGIDSDGAFLGDFESCARLSESGRSLREFQLLDRLFKYRCSYMIYSEAFDSLPEILKTRVLARLKAGLDGKDDEEIFGHLSGSERKRIREILEETLPAFREA